MRSRLLLGLLLPGLLLTAGSPKAPKPPKYRTTVKGAKEARAIAEQETGGRAVSARRIPLNGASGGWEVDLRMPGDEKGLRCVIDADTRQIHSRTRIDQPGAKARGEGPLKVVKGTR